LSELTELENDAELLYKDLKEGGDPQQIIKAMTDNYNSRIKLLDQLTNDLNDLKQ
jgi:cytochrome c-type biogenesis protein CcmH/NrfF